MSFPLCLPCTHSLHGHVSRPLSSGLYAVHARQPSPRLWELGYRFVTKNYESRVSYDHLALWEWGYRTATKMQNHRMQSKDSLLLRTNGVCIACIATSGLGTGTEWLINIQTIKFLISFYKQDPEQQYAKNWCAYVARSKATVTLLSDQTPDIVCRLYMACWNVGTCSNDPEILCGDTTCLWISESCLNFQRPFYQFITQQGLPQPSWTGKTTGRAWFLHHLPFKPIQKWQGSWIRWCGLCIFSVLASFVTCPDM